MLAELPIVVALVGLAAYVVLAGADFGAGIWHMLPAGRRRRRGARAHPPLDVSGMGGEPRLADLRAGRLLDRLPGRVRLDRLDARGAAADRGGGDHRARDRLRDAQRDRARARGAPGGRRVRALLAAHAVRARRRDRRDRVRPGAGRERRRATCGRAGSTRPRSWSACWPSRPRPTWRPSTSPPTRRASANATSSRPSAPRALGAGVLAGRARAGRARRARRRRRAALRRTSSAAPGLPALLVSVAAGIATLVLVRAGASSRRAIRRRWPSRRSSPAGRWPSSRRSCPG